MCDQQELSAERVVFQGDAGGQVMNDWLKGGVGGWNGIAFYLICKALCDAIQFL